MCRAFWCFCRASLLLAALITPGCGATPATNQCRDGGVPAGLTNPGVPVSTGPGACMKTLDACTSACVWPIASSLVRMSGRVRWNGQRIPDVYDGPDWRLQFVNLTTGLDTEYRFGGGRDTYSIQIMPGIYDVYFDFLDAPAVEGAPVGWSRVASAVVVQCDTVFDVEPKAVTISGNALVDDKAVLPRRPSVDRHTGRELSASFQSPVLPGKYSVKMYPGRYDIYLSAPYGGTGVPAG